MNRKPQKMLQEGTWIWAGQLKGSTIKIWERDPSVILEARSSRRLEFLIYSNRGTVTWPQRWNEKNETDKSAGKLIVFCQRDELFGCSLSLERNSPALGNNPKPQSSSEVRCLGSSPWCAASWLQVFVLATALETRFSSF